MISSLRRYLLNVFDNFGVPFAASLFCVYTFVVGAVGQLVQIGALAYFKHLKLPADKYQSYFIVVWTPWSLKSVIGFLSDSLPLFGYHKRSYIVIVSFFGTCALATLGVIPISTDTVLVAVMLLTLYSIQSATTDLLTEGKYAELMVQRPETSTDLVSFKYLLLGIGNVLGASIAGPVADTGYIRVIFMVGAVLTSMSFIPALFGWFPEERLAPEDRHFQYDKIRKHGELVKFVPFLVIAAVIVGASSFASDRVQAISSISVIVCLCMLAYTFLPRILFCTNVYLMLQAAFRVSLDGAMDYWFTSDPSCVPGGPNFSYTFYTTFSNVIGNAASLIGIFIVQRFLRKASYRSAFVLATILKLATSIFDIGLVKRWNISIGIPDKVAFTLGDAVISRVVGVLNSIPAAVLTSKSCPKGMEASVYSFLVSFENLGWQISRALGDELIALLDIKSVDKCDFSMLPRALLIANVVMPMCIFPIIFLLIPNARMTDQLVEEDEIPSSLQEASSSSEDFAAPECLAMSESGAERNECDSRLAPESSDVKISETGKSVQF